MKTMNYIRQITGLKCIFTKSGDVHTLETLAAIEIRWENFLTLKIRTVNVVDLRTRIDFTDYTGKTVFT